MEDKDQPLIRLVKEHQSQLTNCKSIKKEVLRTNFYFVDFFYKAISRTINFNDSANE